MRKCVVLLVISIAIPGFSGGFEFPDNGTAALGRAGAFTVKADDPTALYYNPAGLTQLKGWHLLVDSNLSFKQVSFTRAPMGGTTFPEVTNKLQPFPGPMLVLTTDFGLKDWTFAAGIYGPSAVGKVSYPEDPKNLYPKVAPQKFELLSMDVMLAYYTLAAAWQATRNFSVGISLQWADMWHSRFSQWVNAAYFKEDPTRQWPPPEYDVVAHLDLKDHFAFTMLLGMKFKVHPSFEFALSARPIPVKFHTSGTLKVDFPTEFLSDMHEGGNLYLKTNKAYMDIELPIYVRWGARYIHRKGDRELFDVELDAVWEHWSTTKEYNISFDSTLVLKDAEYDLNPIAIPKDYKDTWSVRLGGDYNVWRGKTNSLWLRAGIFYETGAVPYNTTFLDFMSFDRVGIAAGLTWRLWIFDLKIAYEHIFQPSRTVTNSKITENMPLSPCQAPYTSDDCVNKGQPPGPVVGNGTYKASYDVVSAGVTLNFDRL